METVIVILSAIIVAMGVVIYKKEIARVAAQTKLEEISRVRGAMLDQFRLLSGEILKSQRAESREFVIEPFAKQMRDIKESFDKKIEDMNKNTTESKTSLEEQLKFLGENSANLQREAKQLSDALKNKKEQGNWGEFQLEKIFEILGFVEGREYTRQEFARDGDTRRFTDYILNLPNNRRVIIDSKMSLESYMKYANATDDASRRAAMREFVAATKNHIKSLGDKSYQNIVRDAKLDYVFMFMPLEHAYLSLLESEPAIYQFAFDNNVAIVTPSLLFPMMRTVDNLLKIDKQNKNIDEVVGMVNSLYEKYVGFTDSFDDVGKKLNAAQKSYDESVKRLTSGAGNMSGWIEKIQKKSGIKSTKKPAIGCAENETESEN
ncbi:MAG: DNA recombination protein RmuC [Rickettsiales bacterium]|jgi:DNA recombination protein RmuC|nr:DNA recombination protein RmuC [Rickettsiales bacterium]